MKKKIVCCIGLLLLTVLILNGMQMLTMPKYMTSSREGALIGEYYAETTDHDVLFVGDCEVYEAFTPPTLWEEYGITSYIRGSAQQLVWQSYYLLEEMLKRETPQAVVFNVLSLEYGTPQNEAYNRMTLDGMRISGSKLRAVLASVTKEETPVSYLFPLLRFHSRWDELTEEDFTYLFHRDRVSHNGYLMQTAVKAKTEDLPGEVLADYTLPSVSMEWLERMRVLCEEKGVTLILVKTPTNNWKYHWYDEWDQQITDYAARQELPYYNFIPLSEEIGLDWATDTYDGGVHLNVYGAEKLTSYFGAILSETFGLEDRRSEPALSAVWSQKMTDYYQERNGTDAGKETE